MPQNSILYLMAAAVVVTLSWLVPRRYGAVFQALAGSALLVWLDRVSLPVLLGLTVIVHWTTRKPVRFAGARLDSVAFGVALAFCAVRVGQRAEEWFSLASIASPVGFSFYMLRLWHYRAEAVRGNLRRHGFVELYAYLAFFPTLILGPIHRADTFFRWHARRRFSREDLAFGLRRVLYGYAKAVVLGRWLVAHQELYVDTIPFPALEVLFASLQYGLYLYFTFSGLSDVAVGLARAMGYRIEENFNAPFLKRNLAEFWRSWHMSLSDWCRRYVFLPVFARTRNNVIALYATMITLGLWHEFTVRYVLWGAWHAGGLAVVRWYEAAVEPRLPVADTPLWRGLSRVFATSLTFTFVVVGFTITRSRTPSAMLDSFWTMLTGWSAT